MSLPKAKFFLTCIVTSKERRSSSDQPFKPLYCLGAGKHQQWCRFRLWVKHDWEVGLQFLAQAGDDLKLLVFLLLHIYRKSFYQISVFSLLSMDYFSPWHCWTKAIFSVCIGYLAWGTGKSHSLFGTIRNVDLGITLCITVFDDQEAYTLNSAWFYPCHHCRWGPPWCQVSCIRSHHLKAGLSFQILTLWCTQATPPCITSGHYRLWP